MTGSRAAQRIVTPPKVRTSKKNKIPSTASSTRQTSSRKLDRVLAGRIQKQRGVSSPLVESLEDYDEGSSKLDEVELELEADRYEEMMQEKALFPGSDDWAPDEEELFRILFMRQYSPLLPSHWGLDFRGIPVPDILFATSEVDEPVVYSSSNQDLRATKAIIRLIDLTALVRAFVQTNQKAKIPSLIKKEVGQYLKWAAQDGGYDDMDILTNIFVEVVDVNTGGAEIAGYMQERLRESARAHRRFWRARKDGDETDGEDELMLEPQEPEYIVHPPVLYGLFVVNTTLLVLTVDPAKGEFAHVSYQVEVNFNKRNQGVWNAMTVAIVGCQARNDTIWRKPYYSDLRK
ncbi:hypothetical protein jhhlp_003668 [Lomentospora prolificans]|uniref:Uncharacterized protein n=1 Tax=Lomentospora prolificans TaxID=41688 RepID=A0A2N3N9E5_9PEZI|nr:hypothetical protein jhhlp_003668 [Lomentospora prolificans]